ncbi:MAG: PIG-L family deacetylase [DPANN group archaeon]|nr:PIG-L family deacetylase [DPANN group archaeon]
MRKPTVLVFSAHNDDQIIGAGGTLAKYNAEGKKVVTVIFSNGEKSHPWQKKEITVNIRKKEAEDAARVLGGEKLIFIGLEEGKFREQIDPGKLRRLILTQRPEKIFTHSKDDPHPDHRAVHQAVTEVMDTIHRDIPVYSFDIWNPINVRERQRPRLVIDITDTFQKKIEAFRCHHSQKPTLFSLMWNVYAKAIYNGLSNDMRYAEIFYKIR